MIILGIETSCDETAISLIRFDEDRFAILANVVQSQVDIHQRFGGVVPEVAARKHAEMIIPVLDAALTKAEVALTDIDAVAVTQGPGLLTSLIVGVECAKTLAWLLCKPLIPINHLDAHLAVNWLNSKEGVMKEIALPALGLLVSGGHTQLVLISEHGRYSLIGKTLDDAAGESFDKVAQLMGLPYPGGPQISRIAKEYDGPLFPLPHPMAHSRDFNFSFSGLKTAVSNLWKEELFKTDDRDTLVKKMAKSFEETVVSVLVKKTFDAAQSLQVKTVMIGGGVAANTRLREALAAALPENVVYCAPDIAFASDNGVMAATAGYFALLQNRVASDLSVSADSSLPLYA